jgi:hypothetical protein
VHELIASRFLDDYLLLRPEARAGSRSAHAGTAS